MRTMFTIATMICCSALFVACGGAQETPISADAPVANVDQKAPCAECAANEAAGNDFWCESCGGGMVDGKKVGCKGCYEGKTGGTVWCDHCNKGFVEGKPVDCKGCVEAAKAGTACATCAGKKAEAEAAAEPVAEETTN